MTATIKTVKPYQRKPGGKWYYKFSIDGIEYRKCTETSNKRDAEEITRAVFLEATRKAMNDKAASGRAPGRGRVPTLDHAIESYVEGNSKIIPGTKTGNEVIRRLKIVGETIGYETLVTDIRTKTVSDFMIERGKVISRIGKSLSATTKKGEVAALQTVLTHCVKVDEIEGMPAVDWSRVTPAVKPKPVRRLSIAEQDKLIRTAPLDYRRVIEFFLETGFRRTNMIELRWYQIGEDTIDVRQKGDRSHAIPITVHLGAMLDAIPRRPGIDQVFTFVAQRSRINPKSGQRYVKGERYPMTYWGFGNWFRRHAASQGVKCSIHDLRRTHGSETMAEVGIAHASKALGHSSVKVTERSYATFLGSEVREAAERASIARRDKRAAKSAMEA